MKLSEAMAVTYAAMGQELSDAALAVACRDLESYPLPGVLSALSRCRKELRRMTLADILDRIPGGHPGVEEAWAICSKALNDERITIVLTDEMSQAFGVALNLQDDPIQARMAFKESYTRLVSLARDERTPIVWRASLGHDANGREGPLLDAIERGRLPAEYVAKLLPHYEQPNPRVAGLLKGHLKLVEDKEPA